MQRGELRSNTSKRISNILNNHYFQLQELKSHVIEIQKDFQRQVIILKNELEDEKQARIKLEAEVTSYF